MGTLDFCDQTPTVTSPPFIDQNPGTVESGVTFCQGSPCATGIGEVPGSGMVLLPNIAEDRAALTGVFPGAEVLLLDGAGRLAIAPRRTQADRMELGLSALPNGAYRLVVRSSAGQRVLPLVIAR